MTRKKLRSIQIPAGLYQDLKKRLEASTGYITISEMVREALRDFLKKQKTES